MIEKDEAAPSEDAPENDSDEEIQLPIKSVSEKNAYELLRRSPKNFVLVCANQEYFLNLDVFAAFINNLEQIIGTIPTFDAPIDHYYRSSQIFQDPDNQMKILVDILTGIEVKLTPEQDKQFTDYIHEIFVPKQNFIITRIVDGNHIKLIDTKILISTLCNCHRSFKLITNKGTYLFSYLLAPLSDVLFDLIKEDPFAHEYNFDFETSGQSLQSIRLLFDGKPIRMSINSIDSVTEFANKMKVPILLDSVKAFSVYLYKNNLLLNEQLEKVNETTELQHLLFDLNDANLEESISTIKQSIWIQTFENIKELISNICVVACYRHSHLSNLVKLCIQIKDCHPQFLPFLTNFVLETSNQSILLCQFVYFLTKEELISLDTVLNYISVQYVKTSSIVNYSFLILFYLPEIQEKKSDTLNTVSFEWANYFNLFDRDNKLLFSKESRDSMQNMDPIAIAIANDETEIVQNRINEKLIDFDYRIKPCQFDNLESMDLITYAAFRGSINVFKFLLLNAKGIHESTYISAIIGGNIEIVRLCHQNFSPMESQNQDLAMNRNFRSMRNSNDRSRFPGASFCSFMSLRPELERPSQRDHFYMELSKAVPKSTMLGVPMSLPNSGGLLHDFVFYSTISYHRNNILEWYAQNLSEDVMLDHFQYAYHAVTETNNIKAFAFLRDNGVPLGSKEHFVTSILLTTSAFYGYSDLFQLLLSFTGPDSLYDTVIEKTTTLIAAAEYGSIKIIDIILNSGREISQNDIRDSIIQAINRNNTDVFYYLLEKTKYNIERDFELLFFSVAVNGNIELIKYFMDHFPQMFLPFADRSNKIPFNLDAILSIAAKNHQKEAIQFIYKYFVDKQNEIEQKDQLPAIFNKKLNFSKTLCEALKAGDIEITQFLLDKGVSCNNVNDLKATIKEMTAFDSRRIFSILYKHIPAHLQNELVELYVTLSIQHGKIIDKDFLSQIKQISGNLLIQACSMGSIDTVKNLLEINSSPEFINFQSPSGTPLFVAIKHHDLPMVELLLKLPGIDVHKPNYTNETPLMTAADCKNLDIIKLLAPYCKDKDHIWEVNAAFIIYFYHRNIPIHKESLLTNPQLNRPAPSFDINAATFFLEFEGIDLTYCYNDKNILAVALSSGFVALVSLLLMRPEYQSMEIARTDYRYLNLAVQSCDWESNKTYIRRHFGVNDSDNKTKITLAEDELFEPFLTAVMTDSPIAKHFVSDDSPIQLNDFTIVTTLVHYIHSFRQKRDQITPIFSDLIALDFDINFPTLRNRTVFSEVINCNNNAIVSAVISHPRFNPSPDDVKAFFFTDGCILDQTIFTTLLNFIGNDVNIYNDVGTPLLIQTIAYHNYVLTELILNHPSFDPIKSKLKKAFFLAITIEFDISVLLVTGLIDVNEPYDEECSFFVLHNKSKNDTQYRPSFIEKKAKSLSQYIGYTPLMVAFESRKALRTLLHMPNIDVNKKSQNGTAPVFLKRINRDYLGLIVNHPSFNINIQDSKGLTPLMDAISSDQVRVSILLKSPHAHEIDFTIKDNAGRTIIDYLIYYSVISNDEIPQTANELMKLLTDTFL